MIALQSLISLSALLLLVFGLYNRYREDCFRQELFELRDRLFDEARLGHISFDSRAYLATRTLLNGMLRFAHRISLSRFLVAQKLLDREDIASMGSQWEGALSASSSQDREMCLEYIDEANRLLARHLMRSPFFLLVFLPVVSQIFAKFGYSLTSEVLRRLRSRFADFDRLAYVEGRV